MTTLVVGASGATGTQLVQQLLSKGQNVKVIVRSVENLPPFMKQNKSVQIICASVLDLTDEELTACVEGCDAVASCLGHNMTWKGVYGHPRKLVTDSIRRLCKAIEMTNPEKPVKYVLMNTIGNSNRDLDEPITFAQKCVIALIRFLLPPHADNEQAADYLRTNIAQNNKSVEWVAVRPSSLIDEDEVSGYELHPSPTISAIFGSGKVSRLNVANFMEELISNNETWNQWKGQMPVLYNVATA